MKFATFAAVIALCAGSALAADKGSLASGKLSDIQVPVIDKIFLVQVCDLMSTTREMASDSDRILPGDGELPLKPFIQSLKDSGYHGFVSVEVFNPMLSQSSPGQIAEFGMGSVQRFLTA